MTAERQWLAAHTTRAPAMVAPVEKPPAPANKSITRIKISYYRPIFTASALNGCYSVPCSVYH
ncbi:hypothetical protein, partial [Thiolapillus sp.]